MGSNKPYLVYGRIKKSDLAALLPDAEGLWDNLVKNGYLDADGDLLGKYFVAPDAIKAPLAIDPHYKGCEPGLKKLFQKARRWNIAWEWADSVIVALILALLIRSYLFQPFRIPSGSMRMTLIEGDRLFVNKLAYGPSLIPVEIRSFSEADANPKATSSWGNFLRTRLPGFTKPKRGDVVVFRYPVTRDKDFIKRLIAFGGETVEIKDGRVFINDQPVTDGSIAKIYYYNRGDYGAEGKKVKVPEGYYFVMGDNSASSSDGRYWGFVPEHFLIGKADVIFWPLNRMGWIK